MERAAAGLAVLCVVVGAAALCFTPVHVAKHRAAGLIGRAFTYQQAAAWSAPDHPFDIAMIEFEPQPGIRGRATLWWHPGEYTPGPGFVKAIIQRGFRVRLEPIASRSGWKIAEREYIVARDLPISRRGIDDWPRPTGGLLWDGASGVLVVLTSDSTTHGMFVQRTNVSIVAVGEKKLGPANTTAQDDFSQVTSIRLPDSIAGRVGLGNVRRAGNEILIDLVPWAAGDLRGRAPIFRVRLTSDLKEVISLDAIASMP